jgi:hypothetical protein
MKQPKEAECAYNDKRLERLLSPVVHYALYNLRRSVAQLEKGMLITVRAS